MLNDLSLPTAWVLGPFMLPMARLIFVIAIIATFVLSSFLERRHHVNQSWMFWLVLLTGFSVARIVHVAQYWAVYQQSPIDMLLLWQGGFHVPSGVLAALGAGWLLSHQQRQPTRVFLAPILTGTLIWVLGNSLIDAAPPHIQPLPNSIVQHLDGQPVALNALAPGQPLVVNLWASWCPPCRREMPTFARAQVAHPEVRFIYANQAESLGTIQQYLSELNLDLDLIVADPRAQLSATFGAVGLPMTLFFDAQGQLVHQHLGELSAVQLERMLQQLQEVSM